MKLHVVITDESGNVFEGDLFSGSGGSAVRKTKKAVATAASKNGKPTQFDFSLPTRAFMKRYAAAAAGPKKFAILVARLAKGQVGTTLDSADVEKEWQAVSGNMGGPYRTIYGTRAKSEGWIDHPERGKVTLLKDWTQAAD